MIGIGIGIKEIHNCNRKNMLYETKRPVKGDFFWLLFYLVFDDGISRKICKVTGGVSGVTVQ